MENYASGSSKLELRKQNFKTYKYIVSQEIVNAKKSYYNRTFAMYKNNLKKTWLTISETLNRNKIQDTNPISFIDNGHELSDNTEIANAFNLYCQIKARWRQE